jgi:hypothetical protein
MHSKSLPNDRRRNKAKLMRKFISKIAAVVPGNGSLKWAILGAMGWCNK